MVDTFSIPTIPEEPVDYYSLFPNTANPKLVMEPGMLPAGVDIHTATDIYQTLIALNLDTSVNECISDMLDDSKDEKPKRKLYMIILPCSYYLYRKLSVAMYYNMNGIRIPY